MNTQKLTQRQSHVITFVLCAFTAANIVFWLLKFSSPTMLTQPYTAQPMLNASDSGKLAGLLGAHSETSAPNIANVPDPRQADFKLLGIINLGQSHGAALISVGDKPAKPYRTGQHINEDTVLVSVQRRSVELLKSHDPATKLMLELLHK